MLPPAFSSVSRKPVSGGIDEKGSSLPLQHVSLVECLIKAERPGVGVPTVEAAGCLLGHVCKAVKERADSLCPGAGPLGALPHLLVARRFLHPQWEC